MSGEKRAAADPSWEFTVGLARGILIGGGFVQRGGAGEREVRGGRQAACWVTSQGGLGGWEPTCLGM